MRTKIITLVVSHKRNRYSSEPIKNQSKYMKPLCKLNWNVYDVHIHVYMIGFGFTSIEWQCHILLTQILQCTCTNAEPRQM